MSDDEKKKDVDLDFDWDDALADWEKDVEGSSKAESAPMPQTAAAAPAKEPARALYRPPEPGEFKRPVPRAPVAPPQRPAPPPEEDIHLGFEDDDDDDQEHTRIASIPKELIASLVTARDKENREKENRENDRDREAHRASTRPPPAELERSSSPPAVDLDLDDMLDGIEQDTRMYPSEMPRIVSPIRASQAPQAPSATSPATARPPVGDAPPPVGDAPPPAEMARAIPMPRPGIVPPPAGARPIAPSPGMPRPPGLAVPGPGARPVVPPPSGARGLPAIPRPNVPRPGAPSVPRPPFGARSDEPIIGEETTAVREEPIPRSMPQRKAVSVSEPAPLSALLPTPVPQPMSMDPEPQWAAPEPEVAPALEPEVESALSLEPSSDALSLELEPAPEAAPSLEPEPSLSPIEAALSLSLDPSPEPSPEAAPVEPWTETPSHESKVAPRLAETTIEDDFFERASRAPATRSLEEDLAALDAELDAASVDLPSSTPAGRGASVDDDLLFLDDLAADSPVAAPTPDPAAPELEHAAIASEPIASPPASVAADHAPADASRSAEPPASAEGDRESVVSIVTYDDEPDLASDLDAGRESVESIVTHDDEPEIRAGDPDDPDLGDDFADLEAPPASAPAAVAAAAPVAQTTASASADRGAAAARRTVRSRKPRVEVFALVGRNPDVLEARRELLLRLAAGVEGAAKARLLVAAAELDHRLGATELAGERIAAAREADGRDVVAIRAARRAALERRAFDEAATLLEAEARLPLSREERSAALLALSEIQLQQLGDASAAEKSAVEALGLTPKSVVAALLVAEARAAGNRESASADALRRAGEAWGDLRVRAALLVAVARDAERTGDLERAAEIHRDAREADPGAFDALLGVARTDRTALGAEALEAIARAIPEGALRDAFSRRAARVLLATGAEDAPRRALAWLEDARSLPALRVRATAASKVGDRDAEISALESWAGASGGTDRAFALVRLAEAHAASGDLDAADETLRAASLADASLGTIRIVRELLARKSGDRGRLVQAVEDGGALAAAAKLAADPANSARERELVSQARRDEEAPLTAAVLWLDVAAAASDEPEIAAALRHEIDRAPPEQRIGALLALADRAMQSGDTELAEKSLREARELAPGAPVVLRPLGRLALARSPGDAAALWLEEAAAATGARSAFAATTAGLLLETVEGDALGAYRRALDAHPGYGAALWSIEPVARAAGDVVSLEEAHQQAAEASPGAVDSAAYLVRAALLRAESDPAGASALLGRAREKVPGDGVLVDLALRLGEGLSADERANLLLSVARDAPGPLARAVELAAASALEDAGEPARAAELYRTLAARHGNDALLALALDRAELAAGEVARVSERRFAAVRDAADDEQRVLALERLAELDLEERGDPASAVLSLHSILEFAPGHVPSLRALERYYLEQDRREDLIAIEERFAQHLREPEDAAVHLRFGARLRLASPEALGDAADALLIANVGRARLDTWLARRTSAAAHVAGARELAATMDAEVASRASAPMPSATLAMRAAESRTQVEGGSAVAIELLTRAVDAAPEHPAAAEVLARLREGVGDLAGAANALGTAARAAHVSAHAASLWYRGGVLWQDGVGDEDRALEALTEASKIDVGHLDVFDRLRNLLELREDHAGLSELVARRLAAGGDSAMLVELHSVQAKLKEKLGDRSGAKDALKSALALSPEKLDSLKRLAELCLEDEDYRDAAEVLIRIARLRKDRDELRWVFFTLGDIYDTHIPDAKRAEAAFRRVLKLVPDDITSMERLASIFRKDNQLQAAAEQLSELSRVEPDPDRARDHQLAHAEVLEQMGDARRAEQVLETARRASPTDVTTLKALVDFYQRQRAQSALAIHLNRAVTDFRHALGQDLSDAPAWLGLVEVLRWRGRQDAARVTASAAFALGVRDPDLARLIDADGAAPGAGPAAGDAQLDDLLSPVNLPAPARAVLRLAGATLEKVLPFDPRAYRAEKLGPRDTTLRPQALEIAKWLGLPDVEIWITPSAPRVCVPVSSGPPVALLVGRDIAAIDERERFFVLVRALKIAREGLSIAVRAQPQELVLAMAGLVHNFDPHYQAPGVDPAQLQDWSRRIARQLPRRAGDELGPVVFEMAGSQDYDPARMPMAVSELGDRVALVATGSVPAALSALLKLSGENGIAEPASARVAQLRRFPEAFALLSFAIGDVHYEARSRVIRAAPPPPPPGASGSRD